MSKEISASSAGLTAGVPVCVNAGMDAEDAGVPALEDAHHSADAYHGKK